ncbi:MAG: CDP-alcohol phosphatidyltransferase family protein [Planctomycetota bacterium]
MNDHSNDKKTVLEPDPETGTRSDGIRAAIPNALTLARCFMALGVFALLGIGTDPVGPATLAWATGFFVAAAITDALDGYLARRWRVISRFGRVMDPFADKLLVLGTLIVMAGPRFVVPGGDETGTYVASGVEPWMVAVILGRELLITSLRGVAEQDGIDFSATFSGKLKMILQSVGIPVILLVLALGKGEQGTVWRTVVLASAWAMTGATVWSAVPYVARFAGAKRVEAAS